MTPFIQLEGITKTFPGVKALDDVSLTVMPGEVHAIVGENGAGKSTLINILAGELQPDAGQISCAGETVTFRNPAASQAAGVQVVYQELALCPNLSVAENIALNRTGSRANWAFVGRRKLRAVAREAMDKLGMAGLSQDAKVGELTVAQQQMVEIGKAISADVQLLILDEPNSALTDEETAHLFRVVRQLRESGVAIIYVSHRLEEVIDLADRITVLRDGTWVETFDAVDGSVERIIRSMVGREIGNLYSPNAAHTTQDAVALRVAQLSSGDALTDVSFDLHAGEIVGVAGLPDAGKDELIDCLFGLRDYAGEITLAGSVVKLTSPEQAIKHGMALVPANRREVGAFLISNVEENIVAASLDQVSRRGFLHRNKMQAVGRDFVRQLDVRTAGLHQRMGTLSGGNQQKVILARWLMTNPSVLLLHEPTRGIDIGAKAEIYAILQQLAEQGVAVLIVSSELPELIGQCDRVLAMHNGRISGDFSHHDVTEEKIMAAATGQGVMQ